MGVAWSRPQNGSQHASKNCTHMGTGRQEEEGSTARNMAQNCRERVKDEGVKILGRGSISCGGQDSLETESLQPNSPLGDLDNIIIYSIKCSSIKFFHDLSAASIGGWYLFKSSIYLKSNFYFISDKQ